MFGIAAGRLPPLLARSAASSRSARAFPSTSCRARRGGDIDVALPRRESKSGRGTRASRSRRSVDVADEAARRPRLHHQRDLLGSADRRVRRIRSTARDLERRVLRAVDPATFGDDSLRVLRARAVRRAVRVHARRPDRGAVPPRFRSTICRRSGSGARSRSCCCRRERPSIGFALALDLGVIDQVLPEMAAARRLRAGAGVASRRRRLDPHADGDRQGARAERRPRSPRLATVMLGAVCHDLGKPATTAVIDGRIRSLDHEQAGVEPTLSLLDRLNVHTIDGFDVRAQVSAWSPTTSSRACSTRRATRRRRRVPPAGAEGRSGTAGAPRPRRLPRAHRRVRLLGDGLVPRARAALGVEHQPPAPLLLGRHLLELGVAPGRGSARFSSRSTRSSSTARSAPLTKRSRPRDADSEFRSLNSAIATCGPTRYTSRRPHGSTLPPETIATLAPPLDRARQRAGDGRSAARLGDETSPR